MPSKFENPTNTEVMQISSIICKLTGQNFKLDIMLPADNKMRHSKYANYHYIKSSISSKYFMKIYTDDAVLQKILFDKIYIASPELACFQLTQKLPMHRLMLLEMEFCGTYALNLNSNIGFASKLLPITNIDKLSKATEDLNGKYVGNVKKARYVLKWIAENSASPYESKLFLLLCGPRKLGFMQIKKLDLNAKITLSENGAKICGCKYIRPDLSSALKKLAIEYDSKQWHENVEQNQNDKARTLALQHDGWKVITIVPSEIQNYQTFLTIAKDILIYMGQEPRLRGKDFFEKTYNVYNDVLSCGVKAK